MLTRLTRLPLALVVASAIAIGAPSAAPARAAPSKSARKKKSKRKRRARRRSRRKKDIFARAPQVLDIDGKSKSGALTAGQVAKVMRKVAPRIEPCLVFERRRNPELRGAFIEFVISGKGRVLATRVNKKRRSSLARCVHRKLRAAARFPKSKRPRQVAGFRMRLAQ